MQTKTTFGLILTMLGIIGVIYPAAVMTASKNPNTSQLIMCAVAGVISFITGITMVKTTQDA